MKSAYRVLAYLIALGVVVQAASIAFAFFGLGKWIDDGGTLDKAAMEDQSLEFTGVIGFPIHFLNAYLLALLALILLIVSFFAKVSGGVKWAGFILLVVVVQILLGMFARGLPALGALHGMNALLVLGLALTAATRATRDVSASEKSATSEREMV
jgi:heme A synthase